MVNHTLIKGLSVFKWLFKGIWVVYQIALGAILIFLIWAFWSLTERLHIWEIRALREKPVRTTAFIEMERDQLIQDALEAKKNGKQIPEVAIEWSVVPLESIPKFIQDLALVAEDSKFYQHSGFDFEQIEYAIVANHQKGKKARGASTITQQLAKNLFLSPEKTFRRKVEEAILASLIEYHMDKDRILELYLNVAQFGKGVFGVAEGARHHFKKELSQLTLEEGIQLIAVLPSPENWGPGSGSGAYWGHKNRISRNYNLYRGMSPEENQAEPEQQHQAFKKLSYDLIEKRWEGLRTKSVHAIENNDEKKTENNAPEKEPEEGTEPEPSIQNPDSDFDNPQDPVPAWGSEDDSWEQ